jgi:hypothetical protein
MTGASSRTARWVPALAAVLGLLGGIGGAFIGGKVANEGQEKQFQNQRIAQLQDVLIADYGTYLRTAEIVAADSTTLAKARTDEKKSSGSRCVQRCRSGSSPCRFR